MVRILSPSRAPVGRHLGQATELLWGMLTYITHQIQVYCIGPELLCQQCSRTEIFGCIGSKLHYEGMVVGSNSFTTERLDAVVSVGNESVRHRHFGPANCCAMTSAKDAEGVI